MRGAALLVGVSVLAAFGLAADDEIITRTTTGNFLAVGRPIPGLAHFVGTYGPDWQLRWDERRSIPILLQGAGIPLLPSAANGRSALSLGLSPDLDVTLDDAARVAARLVEENAEFLEVVEGSLVLDRDRSRSTREAARWNIEFDARARNDAPGAFVFVRIENGNAVQLGTGRRGDGAAGAASESDPLGLADPAALPCEARSAYTLALFYDDDDGNLLNGTPNAGRIHETLNARGAACGSRLPTQVPATPTLTPTPRSRAPTATPTPKPPACRAPDLSIPGGSAAGVTDTLSFPSTGVVSNLTVSLKMEHRRVGDLAVKLAHVESGKAVTILDRPGFPASNQGCRGRDVDATFEDGSGAAAETACNASPPALSGTLKPNTLLSAFGGDPDGGTWKLTVLDAAPGEAGKLVKWCLAPTLAAAPPAPTAASTPMPTPTPTPRR